MRLGLIILITLIGCSGCRSLIGMLVKGTTQTGAATAVAEGVAQVPQQELDYHAAVHQRTLQGVQSVTIELPEMDREKFIEDIKNLNLKKLEVIEDADKKAHKAGQSSEVIKLAGVAGGAITYRQAEAIAQRLGETAEEGVSKLWGLLGLLIPAAYGGTRLSQRISKDKKIKRAMAGIVEKYVPPEGKKELAKNVLDAGVGQDLHQIVRETVIKI